MLGTSTYAKRLELSRQYADRVLSEGFADNSCCKLGARLRSNSRHRESGSPDGLSGSRRRPKGLANAPRADCPAALGLRCVGSPAPLLEGHNERQGSDV